MKFIVSMVFCMLLLDHAFSQGVSDSIIAPKRVFILQDLVDNYEHGFFAGSEPGDHRGFGPALGSPGFRLVEGEGISGSTAAELSTNEQGFAAGRAIGISKKFSMPIDVSTFSSISYWVRNSTDNTSSRATVKVQLVIGDGGDTTPENMNDSFLGSTWTELDFVELSSFSQDDFTRIVVNLEGSFNGISGGFKRSVGPTLGNDQTELTPELLANVTAVNILMERGDEIINDQQAIYIDNIVFISPPFNLSVTASPFDVVVSGDVDGLTPISELSSFAEGDSVTVCAPLVQRDERDVLFQFSGWLFDGASLAGEINDINGVNCITIRQYQNSSLEATYIPSEIVLEVQSTPIEGITIEKGTHPGTTHYDTNVQVGQRVSLEAPSSHDSGGQTFHFLRWKIDEEVQPEQQNIIEFVINTNTTITAEYGQGDFFVTVTSIPVNGIPIEGNPEIQEGLTDYSFPVNDGAPLDLTAPSTFEFSGITLNFQHWLVIKDGNSEPTDENENLSVQVTGNTIVMAVYDPILTLKNQWNLISTPAALNSTAQSNLRSQTEVPLWFWEKEKQRYQTAESIDVGNGYWVFTSQDQEPIEISGDSPPDNIPLRIGWNLFGILGNQVILNPQESLRFEIPLNAHSVFWTWDASQQKFFPIDDTSLPLFKQNMLFPGLGYWVYVTQQDQP